MAAWSATCSQEAPDETPLNIPDAISRKFCSYNQRVQVTLLMKNNVEGTDTEEVQSTKDDAWRPYHKWRSK
jgi:hypothetical protein